LSDAVQKVSDDPPVSNNRLRVMRILNPCCAFTAEGGVSAQKEIGANGIAITADVTKSAELDSLFKQVRDKYGRIDCRR
jgi:NAD(P)-dependent dehydrogenase (short-subunit alcohol dehydrogenase family)